MPSASDHGHSPLSPPGGSRGRRHPRLARLLRLFVEIHPDEVTSALLLAANGFVLLLCYYILKTIREPLILQGGSTALSGSELKAYATAAQALLLIGLVPLYGYLAGRVHRARLIRGTIGFLLGSLVIFYFLGRAGLPVGIAYYLWLGIAGLMVIAQFWSFANDYFSHQQGERLFPFIAVGGTLGAIAGSALAGWLLDGLGLFPLLLIAAAGLFVYAGIYFALEWFHPPGQEGRARRPVRGRGGFELVLTNRYLLLIGAMVLVANLVNTHGEYILATAVNQHAENLVPSPAPDQPPPENLLEERRALVGEVYAGFYATVNALALLIQVFVVSRLFKYLGVQRALFVFPVLAAGAYAAIFAWPVFALIRAAKVAENSVDYSLNNTVRHALFLPTGRDAKYKAKAAIDTLFQRGGDLLAGGTVFVGLHVLAFSLRHFALVNLLLISGWLGMVVYLSRRYRQLERGRRHGPRHSLRGRGWRQRRVGRCAYRPSASVPSPRRAPANVWANK